ncbi:MAG TPA: DUF952 domain-containing protein [Kofleriaceae bacterium]|nr:DUF952 domain-containing protein [Kofleriaceae bacterium]
MRLFHLTTRAAWDAAIAAGDYRSDGPFIHLSLERQWPAVRERFYAAVPDLVLLVIDASRLTSEVRFEAGSAAGGTPGPCARDRPSTRSCARRRAPPTRR